MQFYNKSNSIKNLLLFALVLFIAYLPATSFFYFIKNDAFNGYYPPRFFMSESIHAGHLPLWNPYINYGFPQYGDMSGSYWSPLVWIFSLIGYNAYLFTFEIFLYIFLSGVAMYRLTANFTQVHIIRVLSGVVMIGCGFNVSHLQHVNWLSGLAFGIFVIDSFLKLQKQPGPKNALWLVFFSYLFISSAHPTLIISVTYFLLALILFSIKKTEYTRQWTSDNIKWFLVAIIVLIILSAGLIAGYLDIIPHLIRAKDTGIITSTAEGVPVRAWISFFLPMSVMKDPALANTELTMRNMYIGLPAILLVLHALVTKKNRWQVFLFMTALIFLLLATGGVFKMAAYYILPLMSYVRLNGVFLAITSICFLIIAVIESNKKPDREKFSLIISVTMILMALAAMCGIVAAVSTGNSLLFRDHGFNPKNLIDGISWYDTLWIQGLINLVVCAFLRKNLKKTSVIKWIVVIDIILASLLNIPYTGVGQHSVADVQKTLDMSPKGIPNPGDQLIINNPVTDSVSQGLTGHWSMYSKQPGVKAWVPYPITLDNSWNYFESLRAGDSGHLYKPFAFATGGNNKVIIEKYTAKEIILNSPGVGELVIQQNYFRHWKYKSGKSWLPVERFDDTFVSVPLSKVSAPVTIRFEPTIIKYAMMLSFILFVMLLAGLLFNRKDKEPLS